MLELKTFGGASVRQPDGAPLNGAVAQRRSLALLSVLAVHGEAGVNRERLLALLWPDADVERGRHALNQSLYQLRRALGHDDVFCAAGASIRLNADRIGSDVARFIACAAQGDDDGALALYAGPFLDGFALPGCVEFDQWVAASRERMRSMASRVIGRKAADAESRGDWPSAIALLRELVSIDPLSAPATIRLMRATHASGDRTGAILQGRIHASLVREQLEVEPDAAVTRLHDELREAGEAPDPTVPALIAASSNESTDVDVGAGSPSDSAPRAGRWRRTMVRAAITGIAATIVAVGVVLSRSERAVSAAAVPLTAQPIVIAPFRVSGTDGGLLYLREGIVELLSSRLADDSAAHAVDPGRVLRAWHDAKLTGAADTPTPEALRIARRLGASRVVVGGVVGNSSRLVLSATVVTVSDGVARARAEVEGPADSISTLVERLASKLVATTAGEGDRLGLHFTPSLRALRYFLDGQAAYRRGGYASAVSAYERALVRDSSFALAALHLALAADRLNAAEQHDRALSVAWSNRGELNSRDLAHLVAFAGPRYPAPSLESEQVAAWEHAVSAAPDRAEAWYELGERLFRSAGIVGMADAHARARFALTRALTLEPGNRAARRLLIMLAARAGDTALLSRIAPPGALADSVGDLGGFLRWRVALARGDSAELQRVRAAMPTFNEQSLRTIAMSSLNDAVALDDAERATRITLRRSTRMPAWFDALMEQHTLALNQGRPSLALGITEQIRESQPGFHAHWRLRVLDALYSEGDTAAAHAAADSLALAADHALDHDADERAIQLADLCVLEQWRIAHGQTTTARQTIATLRAARMSRHTIPISASHSVCAKILDASLAVATRDPNAIHRVATLDSLMLTGPAVRDAGIYANILVGRLYTTLGNPRAGLTAYRRREYMTGWPRYLSTARREEASLAALTGDTAIARASYRRYLAVRRRPEARLVASVDSVRRISEELEASAKR